LHKLNPECAAMAYCLLRQDICLVKNTCTHWIVYVCMHAYIHTFVTTMRIQATDRCVSLHQTAFIAEPQCHFVLFVQNTFFYEPLLVAFIPEQLQCLYASKIFTTLLTCGNHILVQKHVYMNACMYIYIYKYVQVLTHRIQRFTVPDHPPCTSSNTFHVFKNISHLHTHFKSPKSCLQNAFQALECT
jgi:hypothetical protein